MQPNGIRPAYPVLSNSVYPAPVQSDCSSIGTSSEYRSLAPALHTADLLSASGISPVANSNRLAPSPTKSSRSPPPSARGRKPVVCHNLIDAVRIPECKVDIMIKMIQAGFNLDYQDKKGNTALHHAAWEQANDKVAALLEYGARMVANEHSETAVHWALKTCNIKAVSLMLEKHGISILSHKDVGGFGPFLLTAQNDNPTIMEWLYLKGVSIEEQDYLGRTALHWASYKGNERAVQWLLSRNANIAHRDHEGMTAIHWAATRNQEDVADMLIDVGGVLLLDSPDSEGDTPLKLARRRQNGYLLFTLVKAKVFYFLFGRPYFLKNYFANLFWAFLLWNLLIGCCILTSINSVSEVLLWLGILSIGVAFWCMSSFSDPGWVTANTILKQYGNIVASRFDSSQPVESQFEAKELLRHVYIKRALDEKEEYLLKLEQEQGKYNYQRQILHMAAEELSNAELSTSDEESQNHELQQADSILSSRVDRAVEKVGMSRRAALVHHGLSEYVECVEKGEWKRICIVCRLVKSMRQHHCRECGRCIHRLDHHCPWIDNCVGIGNQRSFYLFIWSLFIGILHFYYVSTCGLYKEYQEFSFTHLRAYGLQLKPSLMHVLLLITLAFNFIWLGFVSLLIMRHTLYMLLNLTTCEVMLRPVHVQRRFHGANLKGQFWFFQDFNIFNAVRNIIVYWTVSDAYDAEDFHAVRMKAYGECDSEKVPFMTPELGP